MKKHIGVAFFRVLCLVLIWWGITFICPRLFPPDQEKPELISATAELLPEGNQIRITISGLRLMRSRDLYLNGKHVPVKSMESFFESCFCIVETSVFPKGDSVTVEIAKRYPYIVPLPIYRSNAIEMECSFF